MPRNLDKRVELLFPVLDAGCRRRVLAALDALLSDNVKARRLRADGQYRKRRLRKGEEPFRAQERLYEQARQDRKRAENGIEAPLEPIRSIKTSGA
jgi:polyphosphate kinase